MQIPLSPPPAQRSPLELRTIRLYSTGAKGKVYTNHFYKSMNHNFGIEIMIQNNTAVSQEIKVGGCVYDEKGNTIIKWGSTKRVSPHSSGTYDFYAHEDTFASMIEGSYKVQFWLNGKRVQKDFFTVTYK